MTSDARTAIHALSFLPTTSTTCSLKLAFVSTDGCVHVYECREPQDLSHWIAVDVLHVLPSAPAREAEVSFALSFSLSRRGGEQLVVAAMETVRVFRANRVGKFRPAEELSGHRGLVRDVDWAVSMGRGYHLIATACKDGHVRIFKLTPSPGGSRSFVPGDGATAQRHTGRVERIGGGGGPGAGAGGAKMKSLGTGGSSLSASLVDAGAAGDTAVDDDGGGGGGGERWTVEKVADFADHRTEVWRVKWNPTGTILSSTGDDGKVRLWKAAINGEFQLWSIVQTPRSTREDNAVEED